MTDTSNLTGSQIIQAAYPDRYYAIPDQAGSYVQRVIDAYSEAVGFHTLPAVSSMIALTSDQYSLSRNTLKIPLKNNRIAYPARYYATLDVPARFFDTWDMSDPSIIPDVGNLFALTLEQWQGKGGASGAQKAMVVQDGQFIPYQPPAIIVPLAAQAHSELTDWIASQAAMATAMGERFTDDMKSYVKAVSAIAYGSDVTTEKLPDRPTSIMS